MVPKRWQSSALGTLGPELPRAYPANSAPLFLWGKLTTEAQLRVFLGFMLHGITSNLSYYVANILKSCPPTQDLTTHP